MKRSPAEIVREYGPFPGVERVNGVSYDGQQVWIAAGDKLGRDRSRQREDAARDRGRRACRHGLRRRASVSDRRGSHPEDRSEDRPCARHHPRARRRRRFRARLGRRDALGRAVSRAQDPSDRSRNGRHPSHHRVQPLRHRGHLGRRRALARQLGKRPERTDADRSTIPERPSSGSICRLASPCRGSNPTARTGSSAAAATAARCGPCAGRSAPQRQAVGLE